MAKYRKKDVSAQDLQVIENREELIRENPFSKNAPSGVICVILFMQFRQLPVRKQPLPGLDEKKTSAARNR